MSKKIEIYTAGRPEEVVLIVNDTRVCGPEGWIGGPIHHEFEVDRQELYAALRKPPTKARLWRRVAKLAGRYFFVEELGFRAYKVLDGSAIDTIKELISQLRTIRPKQADKLEAALAAWEAAS